MKNILLLVLPIAALAACGGSGGSSASGTGGQTTTAGGEAGTSTMGGASGTGAAGATTTGGGGAGGTTAMGGSGGAGATGGSGGAGASGGSGGAGGTGGTGGGVSDFPGVLGNGVWLLGWSGGLDHFTWVRFNFSNQLQGSIDLVDAQCASCIGFYLCNGTGLFSASPPDSSVLLQLPMACGNKTTTVTFGPFGAAPGFPPSATLHAAVHDENGQNLDAFQFPESFCQPDFSSCANPFM